MATPRKDGKWKPGDPINRKRFINFSFYVTPVEKAQIQVLADARHMSQAGVMQDLLHTAYQEHLKKNARDVPPTLLNCSEQMEKLVRDFDHMAYRIEWIRKLIHLSAEYRHEALAERQRITDELMSEIKDVRHEKFKKKARRTGEPIPKQED